MNLHFRDRVEAGKLLAHQLTHYVDRPDVIVLGLPRGGVPVAYEVAQRLHAPLDVFIVRKLGVPGYEELAMGAIASGNVRVLNQEVVGAYRIPEGVIEEVAARQKQELQRRERAYRGHRPPIDVRNKTVILVDDGIATGSTIKAAVRAVRRQGPAAIVIAVPVAPDTSIAELEIEAEVAEVVTLFVPENFHAVGQWYDDFTQTTDEQVTELLDIADSGFQIAD
jgi:predicted phosphoribosyltransferase